MALSWTIEELLRGVEPIPPGYSSEEMLNEARSEYWAGKCPKRKARGGIPMEAFTDRLMFADWMLEKAAKDIGPAFSPTCVSLNWNIATELEAMLNADPLPRSMEERDAQVKAHRLAARRDALNEELRAA